MEGDRGRGGAEGGRGSGHRGAYGNGSSGLGNSGTASFASQQRSRALYFGSVPDAAQLSDLAALVEPYAIVESLRLVRSKSCAFLNLCEEKVAVALHAMFTETPGAAPAVGGKRLTVNFAKARPCTDDQLKRIYDEGARRTLRVWLPRRHSLAWLRSSLGAAREEA